jgi:hypothetical protein
MFSLSSDAWLQSDQILCLIMFFRASNFRQPYEPTAFPRTTLGFVAHYHAHPFDRDAFRASSSVCHSRDRPVQRQHVALDIYYALVKKITQLNNIVKP